MSRLIEILKKENTGKKGLIEEIRKLRLGINLSNQQNILDITSRNLEIEITPPDPINKGMKKAYDYSAYLMKVKMKKDEPNKLKLISQINEREVIVVSGKYDRIEEVLNSGKTPFTRINTEEFGNNILDPRQVLFINCPGDVDKKGLDNLVGFVSLGGYLVTTDWALKNILEKVFPGKAKYNNRPTKNEVVEISVTDLNNIYASGVVGKNSKPLWWLESSSYPIEVLDYKTVDVLVKSKELLEKYGESPIAIVFPYGKGKVFHFISHFYLQQTKNKIKNSSLDFIKNNLGLIDKEINPVAKDIGDISFPEAESTYSSIKLIYNIIVDKLRKNQCS